MNLMTLQAVAQNNTGNGRRTKEFTANRRANPLSRDHDKERGMDGLHLRSLQWTEDGELAVGDRCTLLTSLIASNLPEVQLELIALMERTPVDLEMLTSDVSIS